jgi:hypothetical protein
VARIWRRLERHDEVLRRCHGSGRALDRRQANGIAQTAEHQLDHLISLAWPDSKWNRPGQTDDELALKVASVIRNIGHDDVGDRAGARNTSLASDQVDRFAGRQHRIEGLPQVACPGFGGALVLDGGGELNAEHSVITNTLKLHVVNELRHDHRRGGDQRDGSQQGTQGRRHIGSSCGWVRCCLRFLKTFLRTP